MKKAVLTSHLLWKSHGSFWKSRTGWVIILNTPSHNPTGYALSVDEWEKTCGNCSTVCQRNKKIALLVDAAYMDFSGDEEESRAFLPVLEKVNGNILPMISYSLSKAYTLYGLRCGALVCMAKNKDVAEEFRVVCELSARGAWSNCAKAPQAMLSMIFDDPNCSEKSTDERKLYRGYAHKKRNGFYGGGRKSRSQDHSVQVGFLYDSALR